MQIKPVITEKTTELAKQGKYTFRFGLNVTKHMIKKTVNDLFNVHVTEVRTIKSHGEVKRTMSRRKKIVKPSIKAIVRLRDKEKIDIFESKKGKSK